MVDEVVEEIETTEEETVVEETVAENTEEVTEPEYRSIEDLRKIDPDSKAESVEQVIEEQVAAVEEQPEVAEYTPDYSYKVKDEVLEFDEALRGSVTSKESEDLLRDLYTKSMGLDGYKTKNSELETELGELKPQLGQLVDGYKNIKHLRDSKDYHRLMKTLDWPEEDLIDFAEKLLEEQELPESQRAEAKANRELNDKVQLLESKIDGYNAQSTERSLSDEQNELQGIMSHETYAPGIGKLKEVGVDFQEDVVAMGTKMFNESGRKVYPSIGDVVAKTYELRKPLIERLSTSTEVNETQTEETVTTQKVVERQPTLPKVTGTNNNALEEVMTLDKLREMSDQIST